MLRIVPELAYFFGLPAQILQRANASTATAKPIPLALAQLGHCVRFGLDTQEKAALSYSLRSTRLSRMQLHKRFELIAPHLGVASAKETWEAMIDRIDDATLEELNNRR